jgi:hypothetical protein
MPCYLIVFIVVNSFENVYFAILNGGKIKTRPKLERWALTLGQFPPTVQKAGQTPK